MPNDHEGARALYLDLMKRCLTRAAFPERYRPLRPTGRVKRALLGAVDTLLGPAGLEVVRRLRHDPQVRELGRDIPAEAETMIGVKRLDNLERCVVDVVRRRIPGDLIEAGVWRGGAAIFMRAVLKAFADTTRVVWVADSFRGLPPPGPAPDPSGAARPSRAAEAVLAIPQAEVEENFRRYGLCDGQVRFLPGWFADTLPAAPIERLAVLRLDGDLYDSIMVGLESLYPKLAVGGYAIVDDYGDTAGAKAATDEFRAAHGIREELQRIDQTGVFWQHGR